MNIISIHNKSHKMNTIDNSSSNSKYLPKKIQIISIMWIEIK